MNNAPQIGRILGVPRRLHWSVPVLVFPFGYSLGGQTLPVWAPGHSQAAYTLGGLTLLLLLSLLAHETAHAPTARRKGTSVHDVPLWASGAWASRPHPARPSSWPWSARSPAWRGRIVPVGVLLARYAALRPGPCPLWRACRHDRPRPPYWADVLAARLRTGATVLVVAHGNSLRALAAVLNRRAEPKIERFNIPTGAPLRYDLDAALRPHAGGGTYLDPSSARAKARLIAVGGCV